MVQAEKSIKHLCRSVDIETPRDMMVHLKYKEKRKQQHANCQRLKTAEYILNRNLEVFRTNGENSLRCYGFAPVSASHNSSMA